MKTIKEQIWKSALNVIKNRSHSTFEVRQKLLLKFPKEEGEIIKVIDEMIEVLLLNDRRFAEEYIHHLIQKPIGRYKIFSEARRKGIDNDTADQMLANEGWSEDGAIREAIKQKERVLSEPDSRKKKVKIVNFLRNRGFNDSAIFRITN